MTGLFIAQVCAGAPRARRAMAVVPEPNGVIATLVGHGHQVKVCGVRVVDGEMCSDLGQDVDAAGFDAIYERYSIGHRGGLQIARRLGVPFVLEMDAPLTLDSYTFRAERVTVADCVIEDELLAESDLVITPSPALTLWAARRRHGPTITLPGCGVGSDPLACIAGITGVDC
jgi:hypothetical protein